MAAFYYEATSSNGQTTKGNVAATTRADAVQQLMLKGLQPFVLRDDERADAPTAKASVPEDGPVRLSKNQVIAFSEELSDLLEAGLQLEPALRSMEAREEASAIKMAASRLRNGLRDGVNFSEALKMASPNFGELYCALAHAGEVSGALPQILNRQVSHLKTIQELRSKVSAALIYPAFLMLSGVAVTVLFSTFLIPKLSHMISSTGAKMPPVAQFIMAVSGFLSQYGIFILGGVVIGLIAAWRAVQSDRYRPKWDEVKLKIPFVGAMLCSNFYVQFLETLGNLVQNGLPLLRGLELVQGATPNLFLRRMLSKVTEEVAEGASLSRSLRRTKVFPQTLTDIVRVGEQTGSMGIALEKAGSKFDKELSKRIEMITALIQPLIIFIMAGLVGVMAYLMVTVIYDTISSLQQR